jgi:hypothetical protein
MRTVVTCVYNLMRSHPGVVSVDVYEDGDRRYVVEFEFRGRAGTILTDDFGIYDDVDPDGTHMYTNESPPGPRRDSDSEDLSFLGTAIDDMVGTCHLMPGLDDTVRLAGIPPAPPREKIDMSRSSLECIRQAGRLPDPVAPTAEAAERIYVAVARSSPYLHNLEGRGPISVLDEGRKWGVTHFIPPKMSIQRGVETITMSGGGGDLAMEIDKCTGAVEMWLNR